MPEMIALRAAVRILAWLHVAEEELLAQTVVTFNGETGTVKEVSLNEDHGLCFTFDDEGVGRRFYPVSTIRTVL